MSKEKNDFFNVIELSQNFALFDRNNSDPNWEGHSWDGQKFNRCYMLWMMRFQLATVQQLTMISKHCEKFSKAMSKAMVDIAAEVERTASQR
jgi:hypothetical protein